MEALHGNANDSSFFQEAIENFGQQLRTVDALHTIVADSKKANFSQFTTKHRDVLDLLSNWNF